MTKITGIVKAVCISDVKGVQKRNVVSACFHNGWGIEGDAHGGSWHRQVSLLSDDKIKQFNKLGADVAYGDFAENMVVDGIEFADLPVGGLLKCGDVLLEITQIGKECHNHCQIYYKMNDCIMPREGVFARVLHGGTITVGDSMEFVMQKLRQFRAAVVTLSDRGSQGIREDESGPLIKLMLEEASYFVEEQILLPDDRKQLEETLIDLSDRRQIDLILTTGGTGFSHRDITPEATLVVAQRLAPGIAEAIRFFSAQITGYAMLGRGVSVIRGGTLIVNLPGSPKAVRESLKYVLPYLGHGIEILRGNVEECALVTNNIVNMNT